MWSLADCKFKVLYVFQSFEFICIISFGYVTSLNAKEALWDLAIPTNAEHNVWHIVST